MKRIGIIGCGRFGQALVESLSANGVEILLVDTDSAKIDAEADFVTKAVVGDATNPLVFKEAGLDKCDTVVVCIGGDMEGSILATVNAKEAGVKNVISRAVSGVHRKVLKRIGADQVIYPDRDRALSLAKALTGRTALEVLEVADGLSIAEIEPPSSLVGKTIIEGHVRQTYGITVLAIRRTASDPRLPRTTVVATGSERIESSDRLIVFGDDMDLERLGH